MRYARRTDGNFSEIVGAARAAGFLVHCTNADWDATVQLGGRVELWECKDGEKSPSRRRFTEVQQAMRDAGWHIRTVLTIDDVLNARKELLK